MARRDKKKIRKQNSEIIRLILISSAICAILLSFLLIIKSGAYPEELTQGKPAKEFCSKICIGKESLESYNNTDYGFIKCVCLNRITTDTNKFGTHLKLDTNSFFFDSQTLKEISYFDVLDRINKK